MRREGLQLVDISAADDNVIRLKGRAKSFDYIGDVAPPFLFPEALQPANADKILVGLPFLVRQVAQFHRFKEPIHNHGRAEARAQAEEKHTATSITAERLHGGVVDNFDGPAERFAEIKSHPSCAEIRWIVQRTVVDDRAGITDRHRVVFPVAGQVSYT